MVTRDSIYFAPFSRTFIFQITGKVQYTRMITVTLL